MTSFIIIVVNFLDEETLVIVIIRPITFFFLGGAQTNYITDLFSQLLVNNTLYLSLRFKSRETILCFICNNCTVNRKIKINQRPVHYYFID